MMHVAAEAFTGLQSVAACAFAAGQLPLGLALHRLLADQAAVAIERPAARAPAFRVAQFRSVVDSCVVKDRIELQPQPGCYYHCFLDVASGIAKGGDSMTMAIAHQADDGIIVLDLVREVQPPFQTNLVAAEFGEIIRRYGISSAVSDRVGYGWVSQGITLFYSSKTKSEIYLAALPLLGMGNGSVQLLDNQRLKSQILNLERRVARGGHESVDHPAGANFHDDVANAALGAIVEISSRGGWRAYAVAAWETEHHVRITQEHDSAKQNDAHVGGVPFLIIFSPTIPAKDFSKCKLSNSRIA